MEWNRVIEVERHVNITESGSSVMYVTAGWSQSEFGGVWRSVKVWN